MRAGTLPTQRSAASQLASPSPPPDVERGFSESLQTFQRQTFQRQLRHAGAGGFAQGPAALGQLTPRDGHGLLLPPFPATLLASLSQPFLHGRRVADLLMQRPAITMICCSLSSGNR